MNNLKTELLPIIRKLSFLRIFNVFKLYLSFYLSRTWGKSIHWGMPMNISIEPTNICNLYCTECPAGLQELTRNRGNIVPSDFEKIIKQLQKHLIYLNLYFQGEPLLHPHFIELVKIARAHNIYTLTSSNGHYITKDMAWNIIKSGLDRLIISVDGTNQEIYSIYRKGGNLQTVITGIETLVLQKKEMKSKTPFLEIQFLVFKHNQHQIGEIKQLGKKLGVDKISIKSAQIDNPNGTGRELIPSIEKYSRYRFVDGKYYIKNKFTNACLRMWTGCVFTWDGEIIPCCFDKDAKHSFGNIQSSSFQNIMESSEYEAFRNKILQSRKEIDICRNCTEGLKN